jgi:hypothetical protein
MEDDRYREILKRDYDKIGEKKFGIKENDVDELPIGVLYTDEDLCDIKFYLDVDNLNKCQEAHDRYQAEYDNDESNPIIKDNLDQSEIRLKTAQEIVDNDKDERTREATIEAIRAQTEAFKWRLNRREVSNDELNNLVAKFKELQEEKDKDKQTIQIAKEAVLGGVSATADEKASTSSPFVPRNDGIDDKKKKEILKNIDKYIDANNEVIQDCQDKIDFDVKSRRRVKETINELFVEYDNANRNERSSIEGKLDTYDAQYKSIENDIAAVRRKQSTATTISVVLNGIKTGQQTSVDGIDIKTLENLVGEFVAKNEEANKLFQNVSVLLEVENSVKMDMNSTFNGKTYADNNASANDEKYAEMRERYKN